MQLRKVVSLLLCGALLVLQGCAGTSMSYSPVPQTSPDENLNNPMSGNSGG